jgi:hypothetical protein
MNDAELLDEYQALQEEYHELILALERLIADVQDYPVWQRPCFALDEAIKTLAAMRQRVKKTMDIEDLISRFNFKKVHKIMTVLDWYWHGSEEIPTVENMKKTVRDLYSSIRDHSANACSTGGFTISKRTTEEGHEYLELEFIPVYADTEYPNG